MFRWRRFLPPVWTAAAGFLLVPPLASNAAESTGPEVRPESAAHGRPASHDVSSAGGFATSDSAARALLRSGDFEGALARYERDLAKAGESLSPWHPDLARLHERLGVVAWTIGDYERAKTELEAALLIYERALSPDHPASAGVLGLLGSIALEEGDATAAVRLHRRELEVAEKESPGSAAAIALERLGTALAASRQFQEAKALHLRALAAHEALGDSLGVASCLHRLALEASRSGDAAAARAALLRARGLLGGSDSQHPGVAVSVSALADLAQADGDLDRARAHDREAVAIRRRALGSEHPLLAEALVAYAGSLIRTGHSADAVDAALEAERIRRDHLRFIARALPESQALRYEARLASGIGAAVAGAIRTWDSTVVERVWDAVARSRALVLDEMASRHRWADLRADSATLALSSDAARARRWVARLSVRGPDGMEPSAYRATLERLRSTSDDLDRKLLERRPDARVDRSRAEAGIADVRAALPARSGLVSLVRYLDPSTAPRIPAGTAASAAPETWSYAAFVTSAAGNHARVVPLGDAEELDSLVVAWRRAMTARQREPGAGTSGASGASGRSGANGANADAARLGDPLGRILRQRLWDPIRPHLGDVERVVLVPEGSFHLVNPMALPLDGDRYLVEEGPTFQILSSERDLIGPAREAPMGTGFLALADPDYDAPRRSMSAIDPVREPAGETREGADPVYRGSRPCAAASAPAAWPPLPGSAREVEEIARLWELRRGGPVEVFRGAAATEGAFQKHARGKRAIHLATHGFFEGSCEGENPLLRSGLVLAGANRTSSDSAEGSRTEDGLLTADEIAGMDLAGLETAVLSGCDTGLGVVRAGEGVLGLRRAFEIAGARSLVLTLWPVTDRAASAWTVRYYEARLVKGLDTASAARDASLRALEEQRAAGEPADPFRWGAFIAAGR